MQIGHRTEHASMRAFSPPLTKPRGDELLPFDQVADALKARIHAAALIAIDGLPCCGKSTLAERLASQFGLATLGFDDFYLPEPFWPADIAPEFPFPFFRITEFRDAVRALKTEGRCSYHPPPARLAPRHASCAATAR
jgi:hypothetical protein